MYDNRNIFSLILKGEAPAEFVAEFPFAAAIRDLNPKAKTHILVLPRGEYSDFSDFAERASPEEKAGVLDAILAAARKAGLAENGYRIIANTGKWGGQAVPHLHFHILGGEPLDGAP